MWLIFHMYCNNWSSKISWHCETEQFMPWLFSPSQSIPVYTISKYHCRQCQHKHHIPVYTVVNLPQPVTTSICRPQHKTHHKLVHTLYLNQLTNFKHLLASYLFAENSNCYNQYREHQYLCKIYIWWRSTMII